MFTLRHALLALGVLFACGCSYTTPENQPDIPQERLPVQETGRLFQVLGPRVEAALEAASKADVLLSWTKDMGVDSKGMSILRTG